MMNNNRDYVGNVGMYLCKLSFASNFSLPVLKMQFPHILENTSYKFKSRIKWQT